MTVNLFNAGYYAAQNPDLAKAGLTTDAQLFSHFQNYGLNEGRNFSPLVDLKFYSSNSPDLAKAGLTTNKQILDHLQNYGVAEGRSFSPFVDLNFYAAQYSDLGKAFNGNREQLLQHLQNYGIKEGRNFSPFVDLNFYLSNNSDVNQAFGGDKFQALQHLGNYGLKEGRVFSPIVDLNLYKNLNSDLKNFDNSFLLQHIENYGIAEKRQFSYTYDPNYYGDNNPDLLTAYAASKNMRTDAVTASPTESAAYNIFLLKHFENYGISEGRKSSEEFDIKYYRSHNKDLSALSNQELYNHFSAYGINELRQISETYDAKFYKSNNSATQSYKLSPKQLYEYYITTGQQNGDFATAHPKFPDESIPGLDLTKGGRSIGGSLDGSSQPNPTRPGSYSRDYLLSGLDDGQKVSLDLNANFDTILQLVDASTGMVIAENDNISTVNLNSHLDFTVQPGTEYIVRATSINASASGAFKLTATPSSTIVGTIKADQANLKDTLSSTDLVDPDNAGAYRRDYKIDFSGIQDKQKITVDVKSTAFESTLAVINADTKEVLANNEGGDDPNNPDNSELKFVYEQGINYALRVSSYTPAKTGSFTITTIAGGDPPIGRDQTVSGVFNPASPDIFTLDTTGIMAGNQIRFNLNSSGFDTLLEVDAGGGNVIGSNDDANSKTHSEYILTVTDPTIAYTIKVLRSAKDTFGVGSYSLTTTPEGSTFTLSDSGLNQILTNKTTVAANNSNAFSLGRSDILDFYKAAEADGNISVAEQSDLKKLADNTVRFRMPDSVAFLMTKVNEALPQSDITTADKLTAAVGRWFLGTNPPYAVYTGKGDTARGEAPEKMHPVTFKKIEGKLYGSGTEARIRDINQGGNSGLGDCVYLADLGATFASGQYEGNESTSSSIINHMIEDNKDGTYTFKFFNRGQASYVTVDSTVPTVVNKDAANTSAADRLAFARRGGLESSTSVDLGNGYSTSVDQRGLLADNGSAIWGVLAEKAYAQFREGLETNGKGFDLIGNGDLSKNVLKYVTGRQIITFDTPSPDKPLYNSETQKMVTYDDINNALTQGRVVAAGTIGSTPLKDLLAGGHEYSVTRAYVDSSNIQHVVVRNPWGSDGGDKATGNVNDGFIDFTFDQFVKGFDDVNIA